MNINYVNSIISPNIKSKVLKPMDKYGYRRVILGAFGYSNASGTHYSTEGIEDLFANSSRLQRRVKSRRMYFEDNHPVWPKGLTVLEFKSLLLKDNADKICGHCRHLELVKPNDEQLEIPGVTSNTILVQGEVAPSGVRADVLERSFNNPHEDTCFSIRAFHKSKIIGGVDNRVLTEIIKWDKVPEPGLEVASKARNFSLENLDDTDKALQVWTEEDLKAIREYYIQEGKQGIAMESSIDYVSTLLFEFENSKEVREKVRTKSSLLDSKLFGG